LADNSIMRTNPTPERPRSRLLRDGATLVQEIWRSTISGAVDQNGVDLPQWHCHGNRVWPPWRSRARLTAMKPHPTRTIAIGSPLRSSPHRSSRRRCGRCAVDCDWPSGSMVAVVASETADTVTLRRADFDSLALGLLTDGSAAAGDRQQPDTHRSAAISWPPPGEYWA
jgi:hypothetical protein